MGFKRACCAYQDSKTHVKLECRWHRSLLEHCLGKFSNVTSGRIDSHRIIDLSQNHNVDENTLALQTCNQCTFCLTEFWLAVREDGIGQTTRLMCAGSFSDGNSLIFISHIIFYCDQVSTFTVHKLETLQGHSPHNYHNMP
jgi:hypothetical protein